MKPSILPLFLIKIVACLVIVFSTGCIEKTVTNEQIVYRDRPSQTEPDTGGGLDSSGGDAAKSTPEQVEAAFKDVKANTRTVLIRISGRLGSTSPVDFDERYGIGTYKKLSQFIFENNGSQHDLLQSWNSENIHVELKQDGVCEDSKLQQDKDGSASGSPAKGSICMSQSRLTRLAPETLTLQIIALAVHELSHLYGYDETSASEFQKFILDHHHLTWPDETSLDLLANFESKVVYLNGAIIENFLVKNDDRLCSRLPDLVLSTNQYVELVSEESGHVDLHGSVSDNLFYSWRKLMGLLPYCGMRAPIQGVAEEIRIGDRVAFAKGIADVFGRLIQSQHFIETFLTASPDIHKQADFLSTSTQLQIYLTAEFAASVGAVDASASSSKLNFKDILCRHQKVSTGERTSKTFSLVQQYSSPDQPSNVLYRASSNNIPTMLIRQLNGYRGLEFIISPNVVSKIIGKKGAEFTEDKDKAPIIVAGLNPGVLDFFQVAYVENNTERTLRCEILSENKIKSSDPSQLVNIVHWDEYEEVQREAKDSERVENHFLDRPAKPIQLKLFGGNKKTARDGSLVASKPVTVIKYNGLLRLSTDDNNLYCTIDDTTAEKLGMTLTALANKLRSGAYSQVDCFKSGTGQKRSNGFYDLAPWAYKIHLH